MITRNTEREEKVVAAIVAEVTKLEAEKHLAHPSTGLKMEVTKRTNEARQMTQYFVEKFYKVEFTIEPKEYKKQDEIDGQKIADEIFEKVIAITGK